MWALVASNPVFVLFNDKRFTATVDDIKEVKGFQQQARIRLPVMLPCLFLFIYFNAGDRQ